jgi:hypothetical protein
MSVYQDKRYCRGVNDECSVLYTWSCHLCSYDLPGQRMNFHLEHGKRYRLRSRYWRTTTLVHVVSIPVGVATTTQPTSGWVGFGQSVHGELRAYRTLFKM